jgi:hypothetical protein
MIRLDLHRPPAVSFGLAGLLLVACNNGGGSGQSDTDTPATATSGTAATATDGATEDPTGDPTGGEALDPGRVTVHRLNRTEYNNTVRDLLGTSQRGRLRPRLRQHRRRAQHLAAAGRAVRARRRVADQGGD